MRPTVPAALGEAAHQSALDALRQHLASDSVTSGTRADTSELLDEAADPVNMTKNFFRSVLHVAPFVPSVGAIVEESGADMDVPTAHGTEPSPEQVAHLSGMASRIATAHPWTDRS